MPEMRSGLFTPDAAVLHLQAENWRRCSVRPGDLECGERSMTQPDTSAGLLANEFEAHLADYAAMEFAASESLALFAWENADRILSALRTTQSAAPASEAGERWEGLAGEKGCKHCQGRGWHMVTVDPDLDRHDPAPCSWCLVPRSTLSRPSESAEAVELLRQQVPQWIEEIGPAVLMRKGLVKLGGPLGLRVRRVLEAREEAIRSGSVGRSDG